MNVMFPSSLVGLSIFCWK